MRMNGIPKRDLIVPRRTSLLGGKSQESQMAGNKWIYYCMYLQNNVYISISCSPSTYSYVLYILHRYKHRFAARDVQLGHQMNGLQRNMLWFYKIMRNHSFYFQHIGRISWCHIPWVDGKELQEAHVIPCHVVNFPLVKSVLWVYMIVYSPVYLFI